MFLFIYVDILSSLDWSFLCATITRKLVASWTAYRNSCLLVGIACSNILLYMLLYIATCMCACVRSRRSRLSAPKNDETTTTRELLLRVPAENESREFPRVSLSRLFTLFRPFLAFSATQTTATFTRPKWRTRENAEKCSFSRWNDCTIAGVLSPISSRISLRWLRLL